MKKFIFKPLLLIAALTLGLTVVTPKICAAVHNSDNETNSYIVMLNESGCIKSIHFSVDNNLTTSGASQVPEVGTTTTALIDLTKYCESECWELVTTQTIDNGGEIEFDILDANNNVIGHFYTTTTGTTKFQLDSVTQGVKLRAVLHRSDLTGVSPILHSWKLAPCSQEPVCEPTTIFSGGAYLPDEAENVDPEAEIRIAIYLVPNATDYVLDFSPMPDVFDYEINESPLLGIVYCIIESTLDACVTYHWSINPVFGSTEVASCDTFSFTTSCPSFKSFKKDNDTEQGTELNINSDIKIYPNPTQGELRIESGLSIESIEVIDALGRVQKVEANKNGIINISKLPAGNYFVRVKTEEGITTEQIIKK